jgi:hypothetical protein
MNELVRNRAQLILISLVFLAPVALAWVAWKYVGSHGVTATSNAGQLVTPVRPLSLPPLLTVASGPGSEISLNGLWTYVHHAPRGCDDECRQWLYNTRQVRKSVSKDISRVQRLLVLGVQPDEATVAFLAAEHPNLLVGVVSGAADEWRDAFAGDAFSADGGHVFLVDPLANLMMAYDATVPLKGMLSDLRKLLKASQIG